MFNGVYSPAEVCHFFLFCRLSKGGSCRSITLMCYVGIRYMLDRGLLGRERWFIKTVDKYQQMMTSKHFTVHIQYLMEFLKCETS